MFLSFLLFIPTHNVVLYNDNYEGIKMKKLMSLFGMLFFQTVAWSQDPVIFADGFEQRKYNVFISGHSLVDNPFADYLNDIAVSKGVEYNWNQQIGLGSPIRVRTSGSAYPPNNWAGYRIGKNRSGNNMDIVAEMANPNTIGTGEKYNVLLITERHDIIETLMWEYTGSLLRHYHDRARTSDPSAETYFYHSWFYIDPANPTAWINYERNILNAWECTAEKVNLTLGNDSLPQAVKVIPAGWALADLLTRILNDEVPGFSGTNTQKVDDLFNDNVHLNIEGIYFVAAFSYAIINRSSPEGAAIPAGISTATGTALQQIAWQNATSYLANYQAKTMAQCKTVIRDQLCSEFYTFRGEPHKISGCQTWADGSGGSSSPFVWPDPNWISWPNP